MKGWSAGIFSRIGAIFESPNMILSFRLTYLLLAFASFNGFSAFTKGLSLAAYIVAAWGGLIILSRIVHYKKYKRFPHIVLLLAFLASYAASAILSPYPNYLESSQGFAWLSLEFLLLYLWDPGTPKAIIKRDLNVFMKVFVAYTFIAAVVSIGMALFGFSYSDTSDVMQQRNIGVVYGRLWGLHSDPNYGAVFGVVSVLFTITLVHKKRSRLNLSFLILNSLLQLSYLALSGSRTGLVSATVAGVVLTYALLRAKKNNSFRKAAVYTALLTPLLFAALFMSTWGISTTYNKYEFYVQELQIEQAKEDGLFSDSENDAEGGVFQGDKNGQPGAISKDFEDTGIVNRNKNSDSIDSGRIQIWSGALEVFKENLLWGVSYRSLGAYIAADMEGSYLAQRGYTSMHNIFIDIAVGQGLIGVSVFGTFLVLCSRDIYRLMKKLSGGYYFRMSCLVAVLVAIFVSALVYSEILYINTVGSVAFWMVLGSLVWLNSACTEQVKIESESLALEPRSRK